MGTFISGCVFGSINDIKNTSVREIHPAAYSRLISLNLGLYYDEMLEWRKRLYSAKTETSIHDRGSNLLHDIAHAIFIKCLKCSAPHLLQPQLVEVNLQRKGQRNRDQNHNRKR